MLPSTETTAFVLVPGAYCPASFYHKVTEKLTSLGYPAYECDLPSVGERPNKGPATLYDDAEHLNSLIAGLEDHGKNIVLAANSYGGSVATQSTKGLSKVEREAAGKPGALVCVVYLSSLIHPLGMSVHELVGGFVPVQTKGVSDYLTPPDPETAGSVLCPHLTESEQKRYARTMKPHSAISMSGKLTYASYETIPSIMVVSDSDKAVPPDILHKNADEAIARGLPIKKVLLNSDHVSMLSHPDEVVKILLEAASG